MNYLQNAWYAAAFSYEVSRVPMARTLLDMPVTLFRKENGDPAALYDRCPHRIVPLSRGQMVGDDLECGYHGLRFDGSGACVHNPHGGGVPKSLRVRSFAAADRYGFIWFWPGDPERADPATIPTDFGFLSDPSRFGVVGGYLHVSANYQLVVDNLLDLTHAPFLHPQFGVTGMSAEERLKATDTELVREGDTVWAKRVRYDSPPNDLSRTLFGITAEKVDSRSNMHWLPPSMLHFDLGITRPGAAVEEGWNFPAAHLITPETDLTSHYFFAQARDCMIDDAEIGRQHLEVTESAFRTQDEPMLEAQQACMGPTSDLMSFKPALLKTDAPPVTARRILAGLIEAEAAARA